jgi:hypothetical protein
MRLPPERRLDLLALVRSPEPLEGLLTSLEGMGFRIDQAEDPRSARLAFFQSGGHQILLLAPDVPPGIARQVMESLRQLDPDLPVIAYGDCLTRKPLPAGVTALSLHPSSRAGLGSLLRVLKKLPERA